MTNSKRKLITSETTNRPSIQDVVVPTFNDRQLQSSHSAFSAATNRPRLRVEVQLSKPARSLNRNMIEEGIRGLTPSSFEISLTAEPSQHTQMRTATQNVTPEHKPREPTAPEPPYRNARDRASGQA